MSETYLPVVAGVAVVGERVLRLLFSDGTTGDVDFSSERWSGDDLQTPFNNMMTIPSKRPPAVT